MKSGLLLLWLSMGCLLSAAEPVQPKPSSTAVLAEPPAEITQFYRDVNFAACFSSPEERKLVSHMISTNATDTLPKRLQTVAQAVKRVHEASAFIDPQIAPEMVANASPVEEISEIAALQQDGSRIHVEVRIRSLSPQVRSWLVAQYEKGAQQAAPADLPSAMAQALKRTARTEIHVWVQERGRWVRNEAGVVLLKSSRK